MVDLADRSVFDKLVGLVVQGIVRALMADLQVLTGRSCRLDHLLAVVDRVGHGLFAEHVFAGLQSINGHLRMHPQRRCDQDCFDIFALEKLSVIRMPFGIRIVVSLGNVQPSQQIGREDVAYGHQLDKIRITIFHQHPALTSGPDDSGSDRSY